MEHPESLLEFDPGLLGSGLRKIVVKPNLGYPKLHPVTVSTPVLAGLLHRLAESFPAAELIVLEGTCCPYGFLEIVDRRGLRQECPAHVNWLDANDSPTIAYPNLRETPFRFKEILAPAVLSEADACLSVAPLKRTVLKGEPLISGTVKNLFGLPPKASYRARSPHSRGQLHRPDIHQSIADVFGCLGKFFRMGVVDLTTALLHDDWHPDRGEKRRFGQLVIRKSLIEADLEACRIVGEQIPRWAKMLGC